MKAWVYRKDKSDPAGIHIFKEEVSQPAPEPNQVLLRVEKVSVCGTDEALFRGSLAKVPDGIIPGHEFYGEIVELGRDVRHLRVGQKIAGESHYQVPGVPDQGIIGLWGPEVRKGELLPPLHGAYSEYLVIPAECAHPVPGEMISEHFWPSLFEAVGNDYFLVRRVQHVRSVRYLGIFGAGPHGVFAQIFARHFAIPKIAAFEPDPFRRQFSENLGAADKVLDPTEDLHNKVADFTDGNQFDVTIDMVGKQGQGFHSCCETTRDGGTILLFGLFSGDKFSINDVPGNELIFKMKTVNYEYKGKYLRLEGITGREGIWNELIQAVSQNILLQEQLMKPVQVKGTLEQLGPDTESHESGMLKRAYHAFNHK
jgi:threonine dehydrogenase-like Zn-dependent dehydrogenase